LTNTIIYGLCDPRTQELRYVGKTSRSLKKRLRGHLDRSKKPRTHRDCWIRSLLKQGIAPGIFEIDTVDGDGCESESHHIAYFKSIGCDLTNHTAGGEGAPGMRHGPVTRARMSAAKVGVPKSAEMRARLSASKTGVPRSAETVAKMRAALKGRSLGEGHRAKISASSKGQTRSSETRAKISAANKGRRLPPISAETRERMAAAQRARRQRENS
jgi:hypothetical protein